MPSPVFRTKEEREEVKKKAFALAAEGKFTHREIGEKLGLTQATVWYYLNQKKADEQRRKRKEAKNKEKKFISVVRNKPQVNGEAKVGIQVSFAAGYTRAWLESYAREHGLPAGELVKSVTSILGEN